MPGDRPAPRDKGSRRAAEADAAGTETRPASRIEVARAGDTILFRVVGLGSVSNAGMLWDFAERSMSEGWQRFAFDFSECNGLDSTFLGTLVGLSQEVKERSGEKGAKGWVAVLNCSEANRELFEIVGADRYVRFRSIEEMEPIETEPLAGEDQSLAKRLALVRRSHENLISIDRRNEDRFGEFLKCLAAELAREG